MSFRNTELDDPPDDNSDVSEETQHSAWLWIVLGAAAFAAVELINPATGVVVLSLKFGWNDWATAVWLRRTDPIPRRGRSCFWFQVALGCWRVCVGTFAIMIALSILMAIIGGPQQQNGQQLPSHFILFCMTWGISLLVATLITSVAILSAWWNRVRVWADTSIGRSQQANTWPPVVMGINRVRPMILVGLALPVTIPSVACMLVVINVVQQAIGGPNPAANFWEPILIIGACVSMIVLPAVLVMVGTELIGRRINAISPIECWPELFPTASHVSLPDGSVRPIQRSL
ncbi:MAG: hypothetical protein HZA46_01470 [Planctomycetales bacterium]|nr:hypothetical protein [Planctomycetales bacterium]